MLKLLGKRRSIRKYKDMPVDGKAINRILNAALLSPSSRGIRPWKIAVVKDKKIIGLLSKAKKHGSAFLKNAPLAFIVIGEPLKSDVWVEDASIVSIIIQLAIEDENLGSCWVQIRNRKTADGESSEEYIKNLLDLDKALSIEAVIAAGYPDEEKEPVDISSLYNQKLIYYE